MDSEDLEPRQKTVEQKNLDVMSIEALHDYITDLEGEIDRVRRAIALKETARGAADAVFK